MERRQGFLPVEVEWEGKKYTLPARSIMPLLVQMESHVTLQEIQDAVVRGSVPLAKMAAAYAVVLNYVGIEIASDELYLAMLPGGPIQNGASEVIRSIMAMMLPPKALEKRLAAVNSGNGEATVVNRRGSSKKRMRRG